MENFLPSCLPVSCLRGAVAAAVLCLVTQAEAAITVYMSKFDQQAIEDAYGASAGFLTDDFGTKAGNRGTFTSFTSATTNITYTGTGSPQIQANDQFGGNGTGNYLGVTSGAVVTATFAAPVQYFGLYITALDANNGLKLYSGTALLLDFSASVLTSVLPNNSTSTVQALDGTLYNTNQYYGQPVTNQNPTEPYAYISFFASAGTTITSVVLTEPPSTAIFETDNYSIRTTAPAVNTSLVLIPEPSVISCVVLGGLALIGCRKRRA